MRRTTAPIVLALLVLASLALAPISAAHAPSGAIFTTLPDGSEVNFNHFASKQDVYLDGGPGPGAPQTAAGLDDGTYVFQITDPSGKTLLSTDPARCRQFTVSGGVITGVVDVGGCQHVTGLDVDHNATTVQMFPFNDTPNPGGVYKAWVVRVEDFLLGCAELGVNNGLDVVDCGGKIQGNAHGFIPSHSKTDNFKVGPFKAREIDTRFYNDTNRDGHLTVGEQFIDGLAVTWTDPVGASNKKWSYWAPELLVFHEAHVESVELGTHKITVANQPGCTVGGVHVDDVFKGTGPRTVGVDIKGNQKSQLTIFIDVGCTP